MSASSGETVDGPAGLPGTDRQTPSSADGRKDGIGLGSVRLSGFRLFLVSRATSWVGTAMTLIALPLLLYQRTGSAALTGLLAALEAVPYLVLGLPAGALVDRWDQRRTLVVTSVLSGLVMASIPVASWVGLLTTGQLLLASLAVSALFVFFDAAGFGAVPALVGRDRVAGASGTMLSVYTSINLIGPALGGVAATAVGAANLIAIDAVSYLVAALLLRRVRWREAAETRRAVTDVGLRRRLAQIRVDVVEGLAYIWSHRVIRTLTLLGTGASVSAGAVTGLIVVVAVQQFHLDDHDSRIGLLFAATAAGSLVTGLLIGRVQQRYRTGTISLGSLAASWLLMVGWALNNLWWVGLVVLALWQAASSLTTLNGIVVRQAVTPQRLQARVNTTARMIAWGGSPLGATLGGIVAQTWGTRPALLIASAGLAVSLLVGLAGPLRRSGRLADLIADSDTAGDDVAAGC